MKCENVDTAGDDGEQRRANDVSHVHQVSRPPNPMAPCSDGKHCRLFRKVILLEEAQRNAAQCAGVLEYGVVASIHTYQMAFRTAPMQNGMCEDLFSYQDGVPTRKELHSPCWVMRNMLAYCLEKLGQLRPELFATILVPNYPDSIYTSISVQAGRNIKLKSVTLQVKVIGPPPFSLIGFMRRRVVCSVSFAVDPGNSAARTSAMSTRRSANHPCAAFICSDCKLSQQADLLPARLYGKARSTRVLVGSGDLCACVLNPGHLLCRGQPERSQIPRVFW
ncbi:hypothetical protein CBL_05557 [Carabus blaptoides fortunei]